MNLSSTKTPIRSGTLLLRAPKFNSLPPFIKSGFFHYEKYKNVRKQAFFSRIAVCELLKAKANTMYLEQNYTGALNEYEQSLSIFRYIYPKPSHLKPQNAKESGNKLNNIEDFQDEDLERMEYNGQNSDEEKSVREMKVALYNNIAACYLKLKDYQSAIAACSEALLLDQTQAKAWYRRAKATISLNNAGWKEYSQARNDLQAAIELDPHESVIEELYLTVNAELAKLKGEADPGSNKQHPETVIEEIKPSSDRKKASTKQEKKAQEFQSSARKMSAKGNIKQENGVTEESKFENLSTASNTSNGPDSKPQYTGKIDQENDVWKMLHGDVDPNSANFSYELSFEINPRAKVPKELQEFGKYIQNRSKELVAHFEKSGRRKDLAKLRENLKQAMLNHQRLENISRLDFSRPKPRLQEAAKRLNIDLNDASIRIELQKLQEQNLEDVRKWMKSEKAIQPQPAQSESRYEKLKLRKYAKGSIKSSGSGGSGSYSTGNYLNKSFGGPNIFARFFSSTKNLLLGDSNSRGSGNERNTETPEAMPTGRMMIIIMMVLFLGYLMITDQPQLSGSEAGEISNQDA